MSRLFTYVLDHDYGFAPNPFHGVCTLATCKPRIREHATIGDYVVGTGSAKRKRKGFLVFFMVIDEIITYEDYWSDDRFKSKRPFLRGSKLQAFGDNIYTRDPATRAWLQANSLHSNRDGSQNDANVEHDTQCENLLIGHDFAYWGGSGPEIPARFRDFNGADVCAGRGHRSRFAEDHRLQFIEWICSLDQAGYCGAPTDWPRTK